MKHRTSYVILITALLFQLQTTKAQTISTVVGTGIPGFGGDGGPATAALLNEPRGVAFDPGGNMYISDQSNYRIRKVNTGSIISTIAGTGVSGATGNGGAATAAAVTPYLLAVDASGNVYHADGTNSYVRKIDASGTITAIAGLGFCSTTGGAGFPATASGICQNDGVAIDNSGNVIFSNSAGDVVYRISSAGVLSLVAGSGPGPGPGDGGPATNGKLSYPAGLTMDISGNIYIADVSQHRIRKINSGGTITTVAGTGTMGYSGDGGLATSAQLSSPYAVVADSFGNVFFSDRDNNRIRVILSSGNIATVAGNGTAASGGDGGPATAASLNTPAGLTIKDGVLYIADLLNHRVRSLSLRPGDISGTSTVCVGATVTLGNATSNGTWSSSSVANATVGSTDGIITGVSAGTAIITYSAYGYSTTQMVTVTGVPAPGAITGTSTVCPGSVVTLSNSTPGGTWTSSGSAISIAGSVVTGVTPGTATVTYTVSNACGSGEVTFPITVDPSPNAGTITGPATLCIGATTTLTTTGSGGTWATIAGSISMTGGVVTGVSAGTAFITYIVTNSCGNASANTTIEVIDCTPAGVATIASSALTLHPVPAGNVLAISGEDIIGTVAVRDIFGKTLLSGQYNATEARIDISSLAPGTYFLTAGQRKAIAFLKK